MYLVGRLVQHTYKNIYIFFIRKKAWHGRDNRMIYYYLFSSKQGRLGYVACEFVSMIIGFKCVGKIPGPDPTLR
jgi:hypothetical protein